MTRPSSLLRVLLALGACAAPALARAQALGELREAAGPAASGAQTPVVGAAPIADLSGDYQRAWSDGERALGPERLRKLRAYEVLFVPGFLSRFYPVYFNDQLRWLAQTSVGVDRDYVRVNSEESPAFNARIIAAAIEASPKDVIIISHSKGSLDTLQALISRPELRGKVKGWISLQGALLGSPVADYVSDNSIPASAREAMWNLVGSRQSLLSLTIPRAEAFYAANKSAADAVLARVPTIAFVSRKDWGASLPHSAAGATLILSGAIMARHGIESDGLVPVERASLPGMAVVEASGVDHADTVMGGYDKVRLTRALLSLLLERTR